MGTLFSTEAHMHWLTMGQSLELAMKLNEALGAKKFSYDLMLLTT